ncbi:hypothetical protein FRB99_001647 [Tulasnella sp. 403]|nr:hypothetical protein FRB99_001647 [Tulasnella sp. 403]
MPSSSIIAHRMRGSSYACPRPTVSSFIDGLSPHPSVHSDAFVSSSPPPLVSGLERHPDAPEGFASTLFLDYFDYDDSPYAPELPEQEEYDGTPAESSHISGGSQYSRFSRRSRFLSGSQLSGSFQTNSNLPAYAEPYDSSPSSSAFSSTNSASTTSFDSEPSTDGFSAFYATRGSSPFADLRDRKRSVSPETNISTPQPEPELISLGDDGNDSWPTSTMISNPFSDFVCSKDPPSGLPRSPSPNTISRMVMEYLRGM